MRFVATVPQYPQCRLAALTSNKIKGRSLHLASSLQLEDAVRPARESRRIVVSTDASLFRFIIMSNLNHRFLSMYEWVYRPRLESVIPPEPKPILESPGLTPLHVYGVAFYEMRFIMFARILGEVRPSDPDSLALSRGIQLSCKRSGASHCTVAVWYRGELRLVPCLYMASNLDKRHLRKAKDAARLEKFKKNLLLIQGEKPRWYEVYMFTSSPLQEKAVIWHRQT